MARKSEPTAVEVSRRNSPALPTPGFLISSARQNTPYSLAAAGANDAATAALRGDVFQATGEFRLDEDQARRIVRAALRALASELDGLEFDALQHHRRRAGRLGHGAGNGRLRLRQGNSRCARRHRRRGHRHRGHRIG